MPAATTTILITGNLHYHRMTTRYHGDNYVWNGSTSGPTTVQPIVSTTSINHGAIEDLG